MFPLSGSFIAVFWFSAFWVLTAYCVLGAGKQPYLVALPIAVFAGVVVVHVRSWRGVQYEQLGLIFQGGTLLIFALASVLWVAVIVRGLNYAAKRTKFDPSTRAGRLVRPVVVILPAIVIVLFSFERQIVPDAKCTNDSITFLVGEQPLTIGPEFAANILRTGAGAEKSRFTRYSADYKRKEDLRILCDVSEDGQAAPPVSMVWLSSRNLAPAFEAICREGKGVAPGYCQRYSGDIGGAINSFKLVTSETLRFQYFERWFRHEDDPRVFKGGTPDNGFICIGDNESLSIDCTIRRPLGTGATVLAEGSVAAGRTREQTLATLNAAIDFILLALGR